MISLIAFATILASAAHPHLYHTPDDIERARLNVQRFGWAKDYFAEIRQSADKWAAKPEEQLRALVPPPGSRFAYGFSGCPECGANWPWWGQGGVASFDSPGKATCPSCKRIFPDADHPDNGDGWKSPKDAKTYYFIGCYNSFAAQQVTMVILHDLALAYAITGEGRYSRAAAVVFDALADTYPTTTEGSADYPSNPNYGRLERPQYQVARVLVHLADYLDLLYESPEFAAPSRSGKGSVREHIEESIIRDGGKFNYDQAVKGYAGLTNGQADYVRGALAAGLMLGVKEWVDCGVTGPYRLESFLDNCLDRDGHYYETSVGYTEHALYLYVDMAEMLYHMRTPEYPDGIDFYEHPRFQQALVQAGIDWNVFGHYPRFGDWAPDCSVVRSDDRFSFSPYVHSEVLVARSKNDEDRRRWASARDWICEGDVESRRAGKLLGTWREWFLFNAEPVEAGAAEQRKPRSVLGGKGVAVLRSGRGSTGRAVLMRYGPSNNHGHWDDLNINFYALGRELTNDLGYSLGSAHVQTGWSRQTASHNCVVVNEHSQLRSPGGGGSACFHVDAAPVRAFEASSEASYGSEGVGDYRRTVALVDLPGGRSYLLDVFRVAGGKQHDLMWHFLGELTKVDGAELGPVQNGSLAGPNIEWESKVGAAGDLVGCGDKPPYWNAPPGNGYGFLYGVRHGGSIAGEVRATWTIDSTEGEMLRVHLAPESGTELATAKAPGILPEIVKPDYAILRRRGDSLASAFVSVLEPYRGDPSITSVSRLESTSDGAVGVRIESAAGTDYVLSLTNPGPVTFRTTSGESIAFDGQFGFMRIRDGKLVRGVLVGGKRLEYGSIALTSPAAGFTATVTSIDWGKRAIRLDCQAPADAAGQLVYVSGRGYTHNSPYEVESVQEGGQVMVLGADLVLGRGHVGDKKPAGADAIANIVPLPRANMPSGRASGYYNGKLIVNDRTGGSTTITDVERDQYAVHVKDTSIFRTGDDFTIYDVRVGDRVWMPAVIVR